MEYPINPTNSSLENDRNELIKERGYNNELSGAETNTGNNNNNNNKRQHCRVIDNLSRDLSSIKNKEKLTELLQENILSRKFGLLSHVIFPVDSNLDSSHRIKDEVIPKLLYLNSYSKLLFEFFENLCGLCECLPSIYYEKSETTDIGKLKDQKKLEDDFKNYFENICSSDRQFRNILREKPESIKQTVNSSNGSYQKGGAQEHFVSRDDLIKFFIFEHFSNGYIPIKKENGDIVQNKDDNWEWTEWKQEYDKWLETAAPVQDDAQITKLDEYSRKYSIEGEWTSEWDKIDKGDDDVEPSRTKEFIMYWATKKIDDHLKVCKNQKKTIEIRLTSQQGPNDLIGRLFGSLMMDTLHDFYFIRAPRFYNTKPKCEKGTNYKCLTTTEDLLNFWFPKPNAVHITIQQAIKKYFEKCDNKTKDEYGSEKKYFVKDKALPQKNMSIPGFGGTIETSSISMDRLHYELLYINSGLCNYESLDKKLPTNNVDKNKIKQELYGGGGWTSRIKNCGLIFDQANNPSGGYLINNMSINCNLPNMCDPGESFRNALHVNELMDALKNEINIPEGKINIDPSPYTLVIKINATEIIKVEYSYKNKEGKNMPQIKFSGSIFTSDVILDRLHTKSTIEAKWDEWNRGDIAQKNMFKVYLASKLFGDFGQIMSCVSHMNYRDPDEGDEKIYNLFLSGDTSALSLAANFEYITRNTSQLHNMGVYLKTGEGHLAYDNKIGVINEDGNEGEGEGEKIEDENLMRIVSTKEKDYSSINFVISMTNTVINNLENQIKQCKEALKPYQNQSGWLESVGQAQNRRGPWKRPRIGISGGGPYTRTSGTFTSFADLRSALPNSPSKKKSKKANRMNVVRKTKKTILKKHRGRFSRTRKYRKDKNEQNNVYNLTKMLRALLSQPK